MKTLFTRHFKNQLKKLSKKFPNAPHDLLKVLETLNLDDQVSIGKSIYKIRVPSSDMKKGKAGGFRSYLYLYTQKDLLVPLCMYAKATQITISETELLYHLDTINQELLNGRF